MPHIGEQAPAFELPDADGKLRSLAELISGGPIILYFYPKDDTPGCTAEACAFRDQFQDFTDAGVQVVGVSADSPESHRDFAGRHRLPFILLSDEEKKVARMYGVKRTLGIIPGRESFVIGQDGKVLHQFRSQFNATAHVREALEVIRTL